MAKISIETCLNKLASETPDRALIVFPNDWRGKDVSVTCKELNTSVTAIASELQCIVEPGESVIVNGPLDLRAFESILACWLAGTICIPFIERLDPLSLIDKVKKTGASMVLSSSEAEEHHISSLLVQNDLYDTCACLSVDGMRDNNKNAVLDSSRQDSAAMGFYSFQKGALTHYPLSFITELMDDWIGLIGIDSESVISSSMEYGILAQLTTSLLCPVFSGATSIVLTSHLLSVPAAAWLHALVDYKVTAALASTKFLHEAMTVSAEELDLSSVKTFCCDERAEPSGLLAAFYGRFLDANWSPATICIVCRENGDIIRDPEKSLIMTKPQCTPPAMLISADSKAYLGKRASAISRFLERTSYSLEQVAGATQRGSEDRDVRAALVSPNPEQVCGEFMSALEAVADHQPHPWAVQGIAKKPGKTVFVFPGQGCQWQGMANQLLEKEPVFSRAIDACDEAFSKHIDWSIRAVLLGREEGRSLDQVEVVKPVLFSMYVALARVWQNCGVMPDAVVGHSLGEVAAAHVAGILSIEEAAEVVAKRSQILKQLGDDYGLTLVKSSSADIENNILPQFSDLSLAIENGPDEVVVGGCCHDLERLEAQLKQQSVFCRRVDISYASHTRHVAKVKHQLLGIFDNIVPQPGYAAFYSGYEGRRLSANRLSAEYWYGTERYPVRFRRTVEALIRDGFTTFIGVSPHPILFGAVQSVADNLGEEVIYSGTLKRDTDSYLQFRLNLANLWVQGYPIKWRRCWDPNHYDIGLQQYLTVNARHVRRRDSRVEKDQPLATPVLIEIVRELILKTLGDESMHLPDDLPFKELGIDSVTAVDISKILSWKFGLNLPPTMLFDYPSVEKLVAGIADYLFGGDPDNIVGACESEGDKYAREPVAIVGMACRLPGGVDTPDALWDILSEERDVIADIPPERWDVSAMYDEEKGLSGKTYCRRGGYVSDVDLFDAEFFGINAREAKNLDPQQRLLLEMVWESLERANILPETLMDTKTGVFVGLNLSDYSLLDTKNLSLQDGYRTTGYYLSTASGRISYTLGLKGPSMTIDTACSASLVAIHQACKSLQIGESDMAFAGGVSLILAPNILVEFSQLGASAPDGRSKAFSDSADGAGWSEGGGILMLKRLSDAERDDDQVLALIRGTAVNQDGRSSGLTAPSGPSQQQVVRQAMANAGLTINDIDYIEAHGTGTPLGDPIEAEALSAVFRRREAPLWLGSAKSNLGHTMAGAGVTGLIKTVLMMQNETIVKTLYSESPSQKINWSNSPLQLAQTSIAWPKGKPRRAGVSSFGISGTNSHAIIESYDANTADRDDPAIHQTPLEDYLVFPVSGKNTQALRAQAAHYATYLQSHPDETLFDVAAGLSLFRSAFDHRCAVVIPADKRQLLVQCLQSVADGQSHPAIVGPLAVRRSRKLCFVYPGQGSQWLGMGCKLMNNRIFAAEMATCEKALSAYVDWSLVDVLQGIEQEHTLANTDVVQLSLFSVFASLTALWKSLGVEPDVVIGHSQGEVAAAHAAGILSLDEAIRIIIARTRAISKIAGSSGMTMVKASDEVVQDWLVSQQSRLSIATVNAPGEVVVAGYLDDLDAFEKWLSDNGTFWRRINVDYASHSECVDGLTDEILSAIGTVQPQASDIIFCSAVLGKPVAASELDAAYWADNLRRPVKFMDAVSEVLASGYSNFLEISAHPVLHQALYAIAEAAEKDIVVSHSLKRDTDDRETIAKSLGYLFCCGIDVDFAWFYPNVRRRPDLPTYAFQKKSHWLDISHKDVKGAGQLDTGHPVLGLYQATAHGGVFICQLGDEVQRWLHDHSVHSVGLMPAAGFIDLMKAAADFYFSAVGHTDNGVLADIEFVAPLLLDRPPKHLQITISQPSADGICAIAVASSDDSMASAWDEHCRARVVNSIQSQEIPAWQPEGEVVSVNDLSERMSLLGIWDGDSMQGLRDIRIEGNRAWGRVVLPAEVDIDGFSVHPGLLGAAMQLNNLLLPVRDGLYMPVAANEICWIGHQVREILVCVESTGDVSDAVARFNLSCLSPDGSWLGYIHGLTLQFVATTHLIQLFNRGELPPHSLFDVDWQNTVLGHIDQATNLVRCEYDVSTDVDHRCVLDITTDAELLVVSWPIPQSLEDVQSLLHHGLRLLQDHVSEHQNLKVIWVTQGAFQPLVQNASDAPYTSSIRGIWGFARGALAEHPELQLWLVDVSTGHKLNAEEYAGILTDTRREWRHVDGAWQVPQLRGLNGKVLEIPPLRSDGTVVITGGFGALARHAAQWLVTEHGIRQVSLLSRRGADTELRQQFIQELDAQGCAVDIIGCDIGNCSELRRQLAELHKNTPIRAVIHTAVSLADNWLTDMQASDIDSVMYAKVLGAWNIHQVTQDLQIELDQFILYSTVTGWFGGEGIANYCAANQCLDALAEYRRAIGLSAMAVGWGYWADTSSDMLAHFTEADHARFRQPGFIPIDDATGVRLLDAVLALNVANPIAAPLEPDALGQFYRGRHGVIQSLMEDTQERHQERDAFDQLDPDQQRRLIENWVTESVVAVLGLESASLDVNLPLASMGMDSMIAVEIRNRLVRQTGLTLPANTLFDYPTVSMLQAYIAKRLQNGAQSTVSAPEVHAVAKPKDIAIIGASCRLPGNVDGLESLWKLLDCGGDAIAEIPKERWDIDALYDPDPDAPGALYFRDAGLLKNIDMFDAGFFNISKHEADSLDPQQRIVLELAWEALEDAGIVPESIDNSDTGVYLGASYSGYDYMGAQRLEDAGAYSATGSLSSTLSGRVSYFLGLHGPSMTIDTACSSSLVSLHEACQALRSGTTNLVIGGGVSVMATPRLLVYLSRLRASSPDGRCKAFADDADGAGWAEGAGVVILKRLEDARRDGDRILAVIKGSAVNQDGRSAGLTAPNGPSQQAVVRAALDDAGLGIDDIDYIEAHGTGTALGDPIEVGALSEVFAARDKPLYLGTVKSNIGHTMPAAGIAGVIKVVAALKHKQIPATLHADSPTQKIAWDATPLSLVNQSMSWMPDHPRCAGISSFGISGTNAHIIVQEAPQPAPQNDAEYVADSPSPLGDWVVLPVSAQSSDALMAQAAQLGEYVKSQASYDSASIALGMGQYRSAMRHRGAVVVSAASDESLDSVMGALAANNPGDLSDCYVEQGIAQTGIRQAFLFPGQGNQWMGMGAGLLDVPAFSETMAACEAVFKPLVGWSLTEVLMGKDATHSLGDVDVVQPVLFSIYVSLAALWRSFGVAPDAVIGHSQGEVAAACVAGILTLDDAALIVSARSQAVKRLSGTGSMTLIKQPAEENLALIEKHQLKLTQAVVNAPGELVVAGPIDALDLLEEKLTEMGVFWRRVKVDYASHHEHIDAVRNEILEAISGINPMDGDIAFYSSCKAQQLGGQSLNAEYWFENLRQSVRFQSAIEVMLNDGFGRFIEISGHPLLTQALELISESSETRLALVHTLERDLDDKRRMAQALAKYFCSGGQLNWRSLYPGQSRPDALPTYAFQRQRYWVDESADLIAGAGQIDTRHPMLGYYQSTPAAHLFFNHLSLKTFPWLAQHKIVGLPLLPWAALVELSVAAVTYLLPDCGGIVLTDFSLAAPLVMTDDGADVQIAVADDESRRQISIHARGRDDSGWTLLSQCNWDIDSSIGSADTLSPISHLPSQDLPSWYDGLTERGLDYGAVFQGMTAARTDGKAWFTDVHVQDSEETSDASAYWLHPALLDAALQAAILAVGASDQLIQPVAASRITILPARYNALRVKATLADNATADMPLIELGLFDSEGQPVGAIQQFQTKLLSSERMRRSIGGQSDRHWLQSSFMAYTTTELDNLPVHSHGTVEHMHLASIESVDALISKLRQFGEDDIMCIHVAPVDDMAKAQASLQRTLVILRKYVVAELSAALVFDVSGVMGADKSATPSILLKGLGSLIRGLLSEMPTARVYLVDRPYEISLTDQDVRRAIALNEPELLFDGSLWQGLRLQNLPTSADEQPSTEKASSAWRTDGTYLISGGLGALGRHALQWLATERGIKDVVLVSRQGRASGQYPAIQELCDELDIHADVVACDISDKQQLQQVLDSLQKPLRGVIHTAAALSDRLLADVELADFDTVFNAKVNGAWHLHCLTQTCDLDAFILYSSFAAVLPAPGQAIYAAANRTLEAIGQYRRSLGLPAHVINWGYWEDKRSSLTGNLSANVIAQMEDTGLVPITHALGDLLLDATLAADRDVSIATCMDLKRMEKHFGEYLPSVLTSLITPKAHSQGRFIDRLLNLPAEQQPKAIESRLVEHFSEVLGLNVLDVDVDRSFQELGLDSLTAVHIRNRLCRDLDRSLPANLLFNYPNITELKTYLVEVVLSEASADVVVQDDVLDDLQHYLKHCLNRLPSAAGDDSQKSVLQRMEHMLNEYVQAQKSESEGVSYRAVSIDEISDDEAMRLLKRRLEDRK